MSFLSNVLRRGAPISGKSPKFVKSGAEALSHLKSNDSIFVQGASQTPTELLQGICDVAKERNLSGIKVNHIHLEGLDPTTDPSMVGYVRPRNYFVGSNNRAAVNSVPPRADFVPVFLAEIPNLMTRGIDPVDIACVQVSPPDKHGYCSLGLSVDVTRAAVDCAKHIVAIINPNVPVTYGDSHVHISNFDVVMGADRPIYASVEKEDDPEVVNKIADLVAGNLISDGATLQAGIGSVPNAICDRLMSFKNLGIHTELLSDGLMNLVESGVVNNAKKSVNRGVSVVGFAYGSQKLYDHLDKNPAYLFKGVEYVNRPQVIAQQSRMVSINSAIEVDLTGQIVASTIGNRIWSGFGGSRDFMAGAMRSDDQLGVSIIALPSLTKKGVSRIAGYMNKGAHVANSNGDVTYVVTEYGIASLYGIPLAERARRLINIAHPDHREELTKLAKERNLF